MNLHRKRNHSSPEHRQSVKNILQDRNLANRRLVLNASLQKMAVRFSSSFGADLDAIDAFKRKQQYQGYVGKGKNRKLKFEVTGNELKLHGHTIATHTADGIEVSNAGFDTPLTYNAFKEYQILRY